MSSKDKIQLPGNKAAMAKSRYWKQAQEQAIKARDSQPMATYREYRGSARLTLSTPGMLARQLLGARIVR